MGSETRLRPLFFVHKPEGIYSHSCIFFSSFWGASSDGRHTPTAGDDYQPLCLSCVLGDCWWRKKDARHAQVSVFFILLSLCILCFSIHLLVHKNTGILMPYFHFITTYMFNSQEYTSPVKQRLNIQITEVGFSLPSAKIPLCQITSSLPNTQSQT